MRSASGSCRSSTTSAWAPRSSACSCSPSCCCSSPTTSRRRSPSTRRGRGRPPRGTYLSLIRASVFVCTLAIQGAATRMMFSMSRDRHLPLGSIWGKVNSTFRTPANAAIAVGVLAAIPILVIGPLGGFSVSIAATGLIYLSYLLTNLGVLAARFRGWPRQPAWFNLGRWGKLVNTVAIVYGGLMLINIRLWPEPNLFGDFGGAGRGVTNPTIDGFIKPFGTAISGMPAWPIFETLVLVLLVTGAIYYAIAVRGRTADTEADLATGEAVVGGRRARSREALGRAPGVPRPPP